MFRKEEELQEKEAERASGKNRSGELGKDITELHLEIAIYKFLLTGRRTPK